MEALIYLDTHVVFWLYTEGASRRFTVRAREVLDGAEELRIPSSLLLHPSSSYNTLHQGTASTSGASHSSVLPVCSTRPARARLPYSLRKVRRCVASPSRGRPVALTSMGRSRPPDSITKS